MAPEQGQSDQDDILHPRFGAEGRGGEEGPVWQHATSVAEYLRGAQNIIAYRCYFFPTLAVQWAMHDVWLQGHAAGMRLASLRAPDGQGRTHLTQYPGECHSPAEMTEAAQGMLLAAAPRALPAPPTRPSVLAGGLGRPIQRAGRPESRLRWNTGGGTGGGGGERCSGPRRARSAAEHTSA